MSEEEWFAEETLEERNIWLRRFQEMVDDVLLASGVVTAGQLRAMEDDPMWFHLRAIPVLVVAVLLGGFVLLACINFKETLSIAVRLYIKFLVIVSRTFQ